MPDPLTNESPHTPADTSTSLLWRAGNGDPKATECIFQLYQPLIHRWCLARGLSGADADDIAQEVLLAVYQGLSSFQRERTGSFRRWMRQISQHKIANHFRRRQEVAIGGTDFQDRVNEVVSAEELTCEDVTERQLLLRQAANILQMEFSSTAWQAFYRSEIDGQDSVAVCQELQLTPGAFRVAKARVRKRLRELMEGLLE